MSRYNHRHGGTDPLWVWVAIIAVVVVFFTGYKIAFVSQRDTITCEVTDKYEVNRDKSGTKFRVETEDCGVLEVGDSIFYMKWDSADRYAQIKTGNTYEFDTAGFRFPLMSTFKDIIEVREVK